MGISQTRRKKKNMNETLFISEGSENDFVYRLGTNLIAGERAAGMQARSGLFLAHVAASSSTTRSGVSGSPAEKGQNLWAAGCKKNRRR